MKGVPRERAILICKSKVKNLQLRIQKLLNSQLSLYPMRATTMYEGWSALILGKKYQLLILKAITIPHFVVIDIIYTIEKDNIFV